ncbi:hypothetical protein KY389_11400 [Paracoccus bogoriensis]|uniref:hypothetical protein n=1 Tax=Paracoccus bogoriensis TaxID=242065 RepID=UPI001CA581CA|nr:hypothetical protein [Paracoccus bogoriensis]MBW7057290.1 hypothetical protein [Paracoccus bogoriensis]
MHSPEQRHVLRIRQQARALLTDPQLAARASAQTRRFAWYIEASARGAAPRQTHRPANTAGRPHQ